MRFGTKVQYVLEELQVLETLCHTMAEPEKGDTAQYKLHNDVYETWKRNNSMTRITLGSSI